MDTGANTRVLLVIVSNPQSQILPHSFFYGYFSNYGEVYKILIFEKGKLWKCFIEMATLQQAQVAQQALNGFRLSENTIMNVYYSQLQVVTFLNNNSGGVDYRAMKSRNSTRTMTMQSQTVYPKIYSQPDIHFFNNWSFQNLDMKRSDGSYGRARTRTSSNGTQEIYEFGKSKIPDSDFHPKQQISLEFIPEPDDLLNCHFDSPSPKKSSSLKSIQLLQSSEDKNGQPIAHQEEEQDDDDGYDSNDDEIMNAFLPEKGNNFMFSIPEVEDKQQQQQQQQQQPQQEIDPYTYISPQFLRENQPSKVVYMRGLNQTLAPINIFNLLSNFGNVNVIIHIKHKTSALVQFEKLNHAQNALDHLNNQTFFGQKLKIFYSNYQDIQFQLPLQSPQTEVYFPQPNQYRFSDGKSISFNPPSQTLHLSNIKNKLCEDESALRELFKGIGTIQAVKFLHINQQKHMALVKLSSIEEALNGAALLHGKEVMGRKINVSFTKSKLC